MMCLSYHDHPPILIRRVTTLYSNRPDFNNQPQIPPYNDILFGPRLPGRELEERQCDSGHAYRDSICNKQFGPSQVMIESQKAECDVGK